MIDWHAYLDDLDHFLSTQYRVEDRLAVEILLSAFVPCPRTAALWMVLETNYNSRDCRRAWFSFGESWLVESLGGLRAKRPHRTVNRQITEWLENEVDLSRLIVEADFDRRPKTDRLPELPFLLGRCLRVHTITAANGATRPDDERADDERTDRLAALTYSALHSPGLIENVNTSC
jgi:hypothetical protein